MIEKALSFLERSGKPGGGKGILVTEERTNCLATMMQPRVVYCLQGNGIDCAETAGCNGKGWRTDQCYTLDTIDKPAVVYPLESPLKSEKHDECIMYGKRSTRTDDDGTNL